MPLKDILKKLDWKSVLSITAVITSLSALYVSWRQLKIASAEQQASVFPYLTMAYNTSESSVELFLSNDGTGPAFISEVEVKMGDSTYHDFHAPMLHFLDTLHSKQLPKYVKSDLLSGWVIRAGEGHRMIFRLDSLTDQTGTQFYTYFTDSKKGAKVKIWYLDLYNNCWRFDADKNRVEKCDKCPRDVLHR